MDQEKPDVEKNQHAAALSAMGASKGGHERAKKLSPEERSAIAKMAAAKRWQMTEDVNVIRATHDGSITLTGVEDPIDVANLEGGLRVISRATFIRAIGRSGKAKGGRKYDDESRIPAFLSSKKLKPLITKLLTDNSRPIHYIPVGGGLASIGYRAELLPLVCNVFIDAENLGLLDPTQIHVAERCRILRDGFALVGIVALIDEATGFQQIRERDALNALMDQFLRKELAAWAKRFPDEFYREIYRLRNWPWHGRKKNPPQVVARYTTDFVYERLAAGIVQELHRRNPADEKGYRKAKHHQWLTEEVGHPALAQHLHAVIVLLRASTSWAQFKSMLNAALPKRGDTLRLPFMSDPVLPLLTGN